MHATEARHLAGRLRERAKRCGNDVELITLFRVCADMAESLADLLSLPHNTPASRSREKGVEG